MIGWNGGSHQTGQYSFKWASERGISTAGAVLLAFSQTAQSLIRNWSKLQAQQWCLKQNFHRCSIHQNVRAIDALQCSIFSKACSVSLPIRYDIYPYVCIHIYMYIYILEYPVSFIKAFFSECQLLTGFHQTSPLFEPHKPTIFAAFFNASSDKSKISSAERYLKSSMIQGISFELATKTPISSTDYHPTSHNLGKLQKMSMFHRGKHYHSWFSNQDYQMRVAVPRYWLRECWWIKENRMPSLPLICRTKIEPPNSREPLEVFRKCCHPVLTFTSEYEGIQPVCWGTWQSWKKLPHISCISVNWSCLSLLCLLSHANPLK